MSKLSNLEKESIILWNEAESTAEIYTHSTKLVNKIKAMSKEYPDLFKITSTTVDGAVTVVMPKKLLAIQLRRPYTEEQSRAAAERVMKRNPLGLKTQG